jgi:ParB family chromosome partitioning protein
MRHDVHFVDQLAAPQSQAIGRMIEIGSLAPNPQQPRREIGDLTDLVASIKEKGVLEPILVRRHDEGYQIIAGERRYHAARAAGLTQIPCIEIEVDERGVLEISLIENLQRRDLDPFEEGDAIRELCDRFNYTHEKIAQKLGKSRTSVTEIMSIAAIPSELRDICRRADISSKSLLVEIARQPTQEMMNEFVDRIARDRLTREDARRLRAVPPPNVDGDPTDSSDLSSRGGFVLRMKLNDGAGSVHFRFAQHEVRKIDVIAALQSLITQLEESKDFPD